MLGVELSGPILSELSRTDADPDPTFHFDGDPDADPDQASQNDADPD